MYELTTADMIWNRACVGDRLRVLPGDRALVDMLRAHGLVRNGGVLHAVECFTEAELADAESGYRFFGLNDVAGLLSHAKVLFRAGDDLETHEFQLDQQYGGLIPSDCSLAHRFETRLRSHPEDFAPI